MPILSGVVLFAVLLVYAADRLRGDALAAAGRTFDRDLVPAAIANSLDALRDIKLLRSFFGSPGVLALLDGPWLLLYLLAIAWIHPLLGLAALVGVALLIFGLAMTAELQKSERSDSLLRAARAAHDQAEDLVRSAETLVAMGMSQSAIAAWRERHEPFLSRRQHGDRCSARLGAFARAGSLALQVGMLAFGAWLVADSRLGIAGMIAAALLLGRALQPVEQLIGSLPALTAARGAWLRLNRRATFDRRGRHRDAGGRRSRRARAGLLRAVCGSTGVHQERHAEPGAGREHPDRRAQRLRQDHFGAASARRPAAAQRHGASGQHGPRALGSSGARTVRRLRVAGHSSVPGHDRRQYRALGSARLHSRRAGCAAGARARDDRPHARGLSHGSRRRRDAGLAASQRRRIALARALYVNPRLLVLDEPSADLDAEGELALIKTLAELKERGVTVVIVEQRTSLLEHVDGMAFLRDGTLQLVERLESPPYSTASVVPLHRPIPQPL